MQNEAFHSCRLHDQMRFHFTSSASAAKRSEGEITWSGELFFDPGRAKAAPCRLRGLCDPASRADISVWLASKTDDALHGCLPFASMGVVTYGI